MRSQLSTMKHDKELKRKEAKDRHTIEVLKRKAAEDAVQQARTKVNKKKVYEQRGKEEARQQRANNPAKRFKSKHDDD